MHIRLDRRFVCASALPLLVAFGVACGASQPAAPTAPVGSASEPAAAAAAASASSTQSPATAMQAPASATGEDKKKADELRELQQDRAKWEQENKAELARWTPELHAASKTLADKTYPTGHAAIQAAMTGKHRRPGDAERDKYRHPLETLDFLGFKPNWTVVEVGPGEGWYTELLAPALAAKGKLIATTGNVDGPQDERSTFNAQRFHAFLERAPELYGKVQTVTVDGKAPSLGLDGSVDMVLLMREVHGMVNNGTLDAWLGTIRKALKPNGVLGIEEHRADAKADAKESSKKGYVPQKWLIDQVTTAGFKLAGTSEVNANPKDTKDYPEGVWTLPPSFALEGKDHDKYAAIGESDRSTLKFVKTADTKATDTKATDTKAARSK